MLDSPGRTTGVPRRVERERYVRYVIERMTMADISRVVEIEKLAYASPWPTSAYRRELQENRWAHYIVARDTWARSSVEPVAPPPEPTRRAFPLSLLPSRAPVAPAPTHAASIIGFAGLWLMVDEAHVTTIATHPNYRGRGVGELMLGSLIDIAYEIRAHVVTLEVRVSNAVAQSLYRKYAFRDVGIRRRYYSDNHEDALIMCTPEIKEAAYRDHFQSLKVALAARFAADLQRAAQASDARALADTRLHRR